MAVLAAHKSHLEAILKDALVFHSIETAFFGLIVHDGNEEKNRESQFLETFKQFWNNLPTEFQGYEVVCMFVTYANSQHTLTRMSSLYSLLRHVTENGVILARQACEAVLGSNSLKLENDHVWRESFSFVFHFLSLMDYKSIRSVFSVFLNKIKIELPEKIHDSKFYLVEEAKKVLQLGLDRNVCLLPSYFVVNEIYKLYPVDDFHPHWALGKEFSMFTSTFKPLAQMLSIFNHSKLMPIVGHVSSPNVWNLEPATLRFPLKGPLPYCKKLLEPQKHLLRSVIMQPYSKEYVCSMLGLKKHKQRCKALEEVLVELMIYAMEKSENINEHDSSLQLLWQHLSSQLIFFILYQFASFPHMVLLLHKKLLNHNLTKGRDKLMWVLLQFISGSIQKSPLAAFTPVIKLFEALYPEKTPLPLPSSVNTDTLASFSMICIWKHLSKKAKMECSTNHQDSSSPVVLSKQLQYLQDLLQKTKHDGEGYEIALLCNAYSTNSEIFQPQLHEILSKIFNNINTVNLPNGCLASGSIVPLEMKLLDSLTVHSKMSLIHGIVSRINQVATNSLQQNQMVLALAPALVETYSRLLVYMEIELLGIKGFIGQVLPNVVRRKAWNVLHALLEMFTFRLHHIQSHYRVNLISSLHSVAAVDGIGKSQLYMCIENATLKLIMAFVIADVQSQFSTQRFTSDPSLLLSRHSEELNRVLILTISKAAHISGADVFNWYEPIIREANNLTPHRWSAATMSFFPAPLQNLLNSNSVPMDTSGKTLLSRVERHYRKLKSFTNDEEILVYCCEPDTAEIFLCLLWKILVENNRVTSVCYHVLMKIRNSPNTKALSNYYKVFADFLVYDFKLFMPNQQNSSLVPKRFQLLNDIVWKYNIIPLDRLILSLTLRPHDGKNSQISFYIIKYLLLQPGEFKSRVKKFVSENSSQHWNQKDWHERHIVYHNHFPEYFHFEGILDARSSMSIPYLPTYFGNICLRFLPVFEILIHRLIELPQGNTLDLLLKEYAPLFKFMERPITFLYTTLHYYDQPLLKNPAIKKKLVSEVVNAQMKWRCWNYSDAVFAYFTDESEEWVPNVKYYVTLLQNFIEYIPLKNSSMANCDWRFNEFPNPSALALHATCVELMTITKPGNQVAEILIDIVCSNDSTFYVRKDTTAWINALALLLTSLPTTYLHMVNQKVCDVINVLSTVVLLPTSSPPSFFEWGTYGSETDNTLALFQATWLHATAGQFSILPDFLQREVKPLVRNEAQLLFVFCLYGPLLQRFQQERTWCLFEVAKEFYYLLERVCRNSQCLMFVNLITDFLYHIKYMFAGDHLMEAVEKTLPNFHPALQNKLRFMISKKDNSQPTGITL